MYEVYRTKFEIIEWKGGTVYRTKELETDWFDTEIVDANKPSKTNIIYAAASDEFACNNITIRKKKKDS
jgi:hypothetical protein